ncbi:MAG: hypothetical protein JO108_32570 [Acidobacteriaceae bacterium]|nr:hypothetical protein [Acidobacteriaceae bacterium]
MDTSITTFTGFLVGLTGEEISKVQEEAGTKLNLEFADHPVGQSAAQQQADLLVIGRGKTRGCLWRSSHAHVRNHSRNTLSGPELLHAGTEH